MPPLGNAMRLINGEKSDSGFLQPVQAMWRYQPFRSDINQIKFIMQNSLLNSDHFFIGLRGIQIGCPDTGSFQCIDLILH